MINDLHREEILHRLELLLQKVRLSSRDQFHLDLTASLEKVLQKLAITDSNFYIKRGSELVKLITKELEPTYNNLFQNLQKDMMEVGLFETMAIAETYAKVDTQGIKRLLKTWDGDKVIANGYSINDLLHSNKTGTARRFKSIIVDGLVRGKNHKELSRELKNSQAYQERHISNLLIQTGMKRAREESKRALFDELIKEGVIKRYRFSATLERRTCPICAGFDGREFDAKNPPAELQTPVHFRCRCNWIPISDKSKKNTRSMVMYVEGQNGQINAVKTNTAYTTYSSWMRRQPKNFKKAIISKDPLDLKQVDRLYKEGIKYDAGLDGFVNI